MNTTFTTSVLATILSSINSASFVSVTTLTEPKMNKRGNPYYGRVLKLAVRNCQFGYDYENAVNNRLAREGKERSFSALSLPWGEWVEVNKLISHKGNLYGRFYVTKDAVIRNYYLVDGRLATAEEVSDIKGWLADKGDSARQSESGLNENQVKPWSVNLDHILAIKVNGCEFRREGYEQTEKALAF